MSDRVERFIARGRAAQDAVELAIVDLGASAHARGLKLEDNPWAPGPREYDFWRRGYIRAGLKAQEVHDEA